jgi:hypothetical protein
VQLGVAPVAVKSALTVQGAQLAPQAVLEKGTQDPSAPQATWLAPQTQASPVAFFWNPFAASQAKPQARDGLDDAEVEAAEVAAQVAEAWSGALQLSQAGPHRVAPSGWQVESPPQRFVLAGQPHPCSGSALGSKPGSQVAAHLCWARSGELWSQNRAAWGSAGQTAQVGPQWSASSAAQRSPQAIGAPGELQPFSSASNPAAS